ncbi:MAG TPA: hypothetical protein VIV65_07745 [Gemmatimonadaceae bacterium]
MRCRSLVRIIPALCLSTRLGAQSNPRQVQPERPTVATHAGTVAPGYLEIETGVQLDRFDQDLNGVSTPTVFKFGLGRTTQFSLFSSLVHPAGSDKVDIGDISAGVKWRIRDDAPLLGRFAILPIVKLPTWFTTTGSGTTDVSVLLISSHTFGPMSMDVNASLAHHSGNASTVPTTSTLWTVSFDGPLAAPVGWVAEVFGLPGTGGPSGASPTVSALFGPTLSVSDEIALDAGAILPLKGSSPRYSLYAGGVINVGRLGALRCRPPKCLKASSSE